MPAVEAIWLPTHRRLDVMTGPLPTTHKEIEDLAYRLGGRDSRPSSPVLFWGADGRTPIMVIGAGVAEASELEDLAHESLRRSEERQKQYGEALPIDEYRERAGYASREEAQELIAEGLEERRKRAKANPVTMNRQQIMERWRNHPQYEEFTHGD